jgi:hypothetical protein
MTRGDGPDDIVPEEPVEVVDALPVPTGVVVVEPRRAGMPPVVRQAAAVAAGSFVAGAATIIAARGAKGARARRRARRARMLPAVVASRTFVVDVHLLAPRD